MLVKVTDTIHWMTGTMSDLVCRSHFSSVSGLHKYFKQQQAFSLNLTDYVRIWPELPKNQSEMNLVITQTDTAGSGVSTNKKQSSAV